MKKHIITLILICIACSTQSQIADATQDSSTSTQTKKFESHKKVSSTDTVSAIEEDEG